MRKVRFLLVLSALLVSGCRHIDHDDHHYPPDSTATLKVILNGPYVLVWAKDRPNVITVFSPRDHQDLHKFYSNSLSEGVNQNVHLRLAADGLAPAQNLLIDPYFPKDFIVNTPVWQLPRKGAPDYLVTIELPLPEKITFMSPLHEVIFDDETHTQSFQATSFILEYKVTDSGKIRAFHGSDSLRPLSSSDLQKQYEGLCADPENRKYYESCANLRNLLKQCAGAKTVVLFFGVGIPLEEQRKYVLKDPNYAEAHAVDFFNNVIPQSFPGWTGPRLALKGAFPPQNPSGSPPMLMETSFRPTAPYPRSVPVNAFFTAVIDCKAGNVIVNAQSTQ